MALNPDDLLIFKAREEEQPEESKKAKKQAPAPQPVQKQAEQPKQQAAQPPQQQQKKPFFQRQEPAPEPAPVPEYTQEEPYYLNEPEYNMAPEDVVDTALEVGGGSPQKRGKVKRETDPRKIASHMTCELHPWRRAYAICDYCKRAFCYEDIVEVGGKYYDLDDIEKVPEAERRAQMVRYNNLSLISSVLLMLVFLVFFYYSYMQLLTMFSNLSKIGLSLFITHITNAELFLIGEMALAAFSFLGALMILVSDKNSFRLCSAAGILTVALFSYQYIYSDKLYFIGISAMSFIAIVTLAYSRVSYETLPETEDMPNIDIAKGSSF